MKPNDKAAKVAKPGILSDEEKASIRAKAKEQVQAELKKKAEAAEIEAALAEERRHVGGAAANDDDLVTVSLNLAPTGGKLGTFLLIDGVRYDHGRIVTVPRRVAKVMDEMMARGWRHQDEVDGKHDENAYRREQLRSINAQTLAVS